MLKSALFSCLAISLFIACNSGDHRKALTTDNDFKEFYRIYSPDKSRLLLNYGAKQEAFDYSIRGTAVLKVSDTLGNLNKFLLPNTLNNFKWISGDTLTASFDIIPSIRNGQQVTVQDTTVNGVFVHVDREDYIKEGDRLTILYQEISPNKKKKLIVYKYASGNDSTKFIHLSIIPIHGAIPHYGNYFIAQNKSDYIFYARWSRKNQLIFFTNNKDNEFITYGLVRHRPTVAYQIVADDDRYKNAKRWVGR